MRIKECLVNRRRDVEIPINCAIAEFDFQRTDAPAVAEGYVETAMRMFAEIGARNDLAMALVSRAGLRKRTGDLPMARQLLIQAREIFTTLGTRGEPARVTAALAELDRRSVS